MHGHCNIVVRTLNTNPPHTAGLNFRFPEVIKSCNSESDVGDTEISFVLDKGFGDHIHIYASLLKISITCLSGAVQITHWLTQTRPSCCYLE